MDDLLSLKWNNHKSSFLDTISQLRHKTTYTDVILACEGKLYNVHKLVLSTCSDYFRNIFESIDCSKPVIILKDIECKELECLLDYMYLGEVNVSQIDLAPLIKTAECLQLKGLAVADDRDKRKLESNSSSSRRKKQKVQNNNQQSISGPTDELDGTCKTEEQSFNDAPKKNEIFIKNEIPDCELIDTTKEEYCYEPGPDITDDIKECSNPEAILEPDPEPDIWSDINPDQTNDSLSPYPLNPEEHFDMPSGSSQRNTFAVKQIACPVCGKLLSGYGGKQKLKYHMLTHTKEKNFACPDCEFRATLRTNLYKHMRLVHGRDVVTLRPRYKQKN